MIKARSEARKIALQVMYQVELVGVPVGEALPPVLSFVPAPLKRKRDYALRLVRAVLDRREELDAELRRFVTAGWNYDRLGLLERIILRMAAVEISSFEDVPCRVSIDEAVELSKTFIGPDAGRLINGILHRYASEKDPAGLESPAPATAAAGETADASGPERG